MNFDHLDPASEALAERLMQDEHYRVLRAVPRPYSAMPEDGAPPPGRCIAIVDLETSGSNPETDHIIELALMLVWVDDEGQVLAHFGPFSWLEDPGTVLAPEITMLTGLSAQQLAGHSIPDAKVLGLLDRADLCLAHNASFEAAWLERRYPSLKGKPWACSMREIPWLQLGLDGRGQGSLLMQHGWLSEAHRAGPDVWALFVLLQETRTGWLRGPRRTHLQRLLAASDASTTLVEARGAPYRAKDDLNARGYRWNADARVWAKELAPALVEHEEAWFYRSGLPAPVLTTLTACERHR